MEYGFLNDLMDEENDYSSDDEYFTADESDDEYFTADEHDILIGEFYHEFMYSVSPNGTVWILPIDNDDFLLL
tara:strand:- start:18673 stop:18891 length:219 start_codon:yes stop_codon:yes gene_type:complete